MGRRFDGASTNSYDPTRGPRAPLVPPMGAICECGLRYGMHRVNDYACPNQQWRPGNGQPQWLAITWKRA